MAINDAEEKWLEQLVVNTANKTAEVVAEKLIKIHIDTCPYGRRLMKVCFIAMGIGVGFGLGGNSLLQHLSKVLGF